MYFVHQSLKPGGSRDQTTSSQQHFILGLDSSSTLYQASTSRIGDFVHPSRSRDWGWRPFHPSCHKTAGIGSFLALLQLLLLSRLLKFLPSHWFVWRTKNICYTNSSRPNLFFAILVLLQKIEGHASNGTLTFSLIIWRLGPRGTKIENYSNAREGPIWSTETKKNIGIHGLEPTSYFNVPRMQQNRVQTFEEDHQEK
jgi:hypothetical protein